MTTKTAERRNSSLGAARKAKNDEFYTQLSDIEKELRNYRDHFRGKTIFLNCDDPEWSNFWVYFRNNFNFLGIQRVIATHYTGISEGGAPSYALELVRGPNGEDVDVEKPIRTELTGDGDFRSPEAVEYLKQADIVVTNPPFSLFREYVAQLIEHDKKFVLIGNTNAITYKEIWPLIESGKMWLGSLPSFMGFRVPADSEPRPTRYWVDEEGQKWRSLGNAAWFTNLEIPRRYEEIPLYKRYADDPDAYPTYDDFDAIEVSKVKDIPKDYYGLMGVPITFLGKHNPDQFEIVGLDRYLPEREKVSRFRLNSMEVYARIIVRRTGRPEAPERWDRKMAVGSPIPLGAILAHESPCSSGTVRDETFDALVCPCGSGMVIASSLDGSRAIDCHNCSESYEVIFLGAGPKEWTLARKAGDAV